MRTYGDFLISELNRLRRTCPHLADVTNWCRWLRAVADLAAGMPVAMQEEWIECLACVAMQKTGGSTLVADQAVWAIRQAVAAEEVEREREQV